MSTFLNALKCQNHDRTPVWLMRQAGRYMPEYRALRNKYSFLEMCSHPELIVQTTLLPIQLLEVDAAIIFSDILLLAKPLGFNLVYDEGVGPLITPVVRVKEDIPQVSISKIEETFQPIFQAIKILRTQLSVPLIGFAGAPFTLASYLIEGKTNRELRHTKEWMVSKPETFHDLLDQLSDATIAFLKMQIEAGVQTVQIFDSWAMGLSDDHFKTFSLPYIQKIYNALPNIPFICFSRGNHALSLAEINPHGISMDWTLDLSVLREHVPKTIALQGNLDPCWLYAPQENLKKATYNLLYSMKKQPGYIFNLGHGIPPDVPFNNVKFLVDYIKNF